MIAYEQEPGYVQVKCTCTRGHKERDRQEREPDSFEVPALFRTALIRQADTTVKTKQNETKQRETADSSRGIEQIHHR